MCTDMQPKNLWSNPHPRVEQHLGGVEARHSPPLQKGRRSLQVGKDRRLERWAGKDGQVGGDRGTSAGDADVGPQTIDCTY